MWYQTKASKIPGIKYPILRGPFGGKLSTAELVSTVSYVRGTGAMETHICRGRFPGSIMIIVREGNFLDIKEVIFLRLFLS